MFAWRTAACREPNRAGRRPIGMNASLARLAAALAVAVLAFSACSSGSSDPSDSSDSSDSLPESAAQLSDTLSASAPDAAGGSAGGPADTSAGGDAADRAAPQVEQPSIISTGSVTLSAKDVAKARAQVQHLADRYGGQVTDQETTTADDKEMGYARLVLRVPARTFTEAMADLEQVADLVDSTTTSEDVSTTVIDVDERVKAARASIDRITTLLGRAEKIGDVMAIEAQLSRREADLNSLLRQQAHLADQTSLATISVSIDRPAAQTRSETRDSGFLAGLAAGWHALRGFATGAATVTGALLPWAPILLLVGLPLWLAIRRSRRMPAAPVAQD
jgi:hypothetical protein